FADTVFFCNSGAEALECAIKMARRFHFQRGQTERHEIITFEGAFHGRTMATISAGGQDKYLEGFKPGLEGFDAVPLGDLAAVEAAISDATAAVLIEPIQGEGGIRPVDREALEDLRAICDRHDVLLILDEVQTGMGRTGKLFAYEWTRIAPDIMTLAKGIGGGFPLGACLATARAAAGMTPGTHGSTFGGNPLACAAGNAVLDVLLEEHFLERANEHAARLRDRVEGLARRHPGVILEVRGKGMMVGMVMAPNNAEVAGRLMAEGLLTVPAGENVVRLLPPLIIGDDEIDHALAVLETVCARYARSDAAA
ncbi:MAG: aspartate aminotransferase family protein, partial [Geminicoccaceae bacterium]|nr:aspartate aminotransferase family protein [Geminicoccaceae bacterium]